MKKSHLLKLCFLTLFASIAWMESDKNTIVIDDLPQGTYEVIRAQRKGDCPKDDMGQFDMNPCQTFGEEIERITICYGGTIDVLANELYFGNMTITNKSILGTFKLKARRMLGLAGKSGRSPISEFGFRNKGNNVYVMDYVLNPRKFPDCKNFITIRKI